MELVKEARGSGDACGSERGWVVIDFDAMDLVKAMIF